MTCTPLDHATLEVLAALEAQDLEALAEALLIRHDLVASGSPTSVRSFELGNEACRRLADWKRAMAEESARLQQFRSYL